MCRPFSQIIQDNQYSSLGLILVAELAKTRRVLCTLAVKDHVLNSSFPVQDLNAAEVEADSLDMVEDKGEPIARVRLNAGTADLQAQRHGLLDYEQRFTAEDVTFPAAEPPHTSRPTFSEKSKRRKASDAIDQLFRGLA